MTPAFVQLVDAFTEMPLVNGQTSEQPLSQALKNRTLPQSVIKALLHRLNDEIDGMYADVERLGKEVAAAQTGETRAELHQRLQDRIYELRRAESEAADLMRRYFEQSETTKGVAAGLEALRRAKELIAQGEGSSTPDPSA